MKRILALCLTLVLMLGMLPMTQAEAASLTLTVKGGWLRLRDEASYSGDTIASYYTGTKVTVLDTKGAWYRVRTPDGRVGYMLGSYLTSSGTGSSGSASQKITAYVTSSNGKGVRLRHGPGSGYGVIRQYPVGTKVTILSAGTYWHYISVDGQKGYMMADYLTTRAVNPAPAPDTDTDVDVSYTAYVTSSNGKSVRMRLGAGSSYGVIDSYAVGTEVLVHGKSGSWSQITVNGRQGYMMSKYLTTQKPGASAPAEPGFTAYTAYVTSENGKNVRLRKGPGSSYGVIDAFAVGTQAMVTGKTGSWSQITVNGQQGYMMSKYLTAQKPGTSAPAEPGFVTYTAYVTSENGKNVRLRKGPGSSYAVIDAFAVGTQTLVTGKTGSWSQITVAGRTGYMMSKYLTTQKPGASAPSKPDTSEPGFVSYTAYVVSDNGKGVRWRKGPSSSEAVISTLDLGTKVKVLAKSGKWNYIEYMGTKGYIMSEFLASRTVTEDGSFAPDTYTAYVTSENGKGVYLRKGAGTSYSSCGLYSVGTQVTVLQHGITWDRVRIGSREGYMMNKFLTVAAPGSKKITGVMLSDAMPAAGEILWANVTPSDANVTYEWMTDNGLLLATTASLTLKTEDAGLRIRVRVTGTNGYTGSAVSAYATVQKAAATVDKPFSGTVSLNFSAIMSGVTLRPTVNVNCDDVTYHWYADGVEISNDEQLRITQTLEGKEIKLVVKPAAGQGFSGQAESNVCTVLPASVATQTDL